MNRVFSSSMVVCGLLGTSGLLASELTLSPPPDGGDAVPVLREALARCRAEGISKLILSPGTWNIHRHRADGMFRHVSNHDPGYKRVAIHLNHLDGFEIDGGGATLLCHGVLTPIAIDFSKNITVRNLTIDWARPFHLEGTVTAVGEDAFDVEMLPACGAELRDGKLFGGMAEGVYGKFRDPDKVPQDFNWNYWIDPATRAAAKTQGHLSHWSRRTKDFAEVTNIGPHQFRIRNAHGRSLPDLGSVMICKGTHRLNRLSPAMHANGTDGLRIENITVHHAGGMGLIVEDCTDPVVRKLRVALKDGSKSLITTTADATHFVGCRGTVTVEDCLFENMLDDSCNVHGVYAIAEGLLASNQLAVSFSHFQQLGTVFARPGDELRLINRDTLLPYGGTCAVTAITRRNEDYYVLTLDQAIDKVYRDHSSVENLTTRPALIYRGNTVRNNRARGILVTAGRKVVIENNRFERPSMSGVLVEGDNHVWYEAGAVEDVTIRNNTFIGHAPEAPLFKLAPMQPQVDGLQPPYHHNIRILGNTIEAASPVVVLANRISGLEFSDNTVTFRGDAATSKEAAIQLTACEDVAIRNNTFNRPSTVVSNPADTAVRMAHNQGLTRK